ncbi:uncharacterized protein DMAD_03591 [Drosophila madeirensis]|uniref:Uncharacterized protein n=1 Tax=Drosophila madeirensis TaxID=30013 RepID=A0AAU9G7Z2_DROMD
MLNFAMNQIYAVVFVGLGCLLLFQLLPVSAIPLPANLSSSTAPWKSVAVQDLEVAADTQHQVGNGLAKMGLFPVAYQSKLRTVGKAEAAAAPATAKGNVAGRPLTNAGLNFWAKPKAKPTAAAAAPKISARAGGGQVRGKSLERTISVPRMQSDHMGNWVFNPWGVTFGVLWQDTRMHYQVKNSMTEILEDTPHGGHYNLNYNFKQTKVCRGKSTIYNRPRVYQWLQRRIVQEKTPNFDVFSKYRPIWLDLRRELYTMGRSESCHISAMDDWLLYNNCAILRNMRMEYIIPKYPLHQIAYWHTHFRKELTYKL